MASIAPMLTRRRVLQVNDEGTKGTAAAGDTHVYAFDCSMQPDDTYIARKPIGHTGGNLGGVIGARTGTARFRVELRSDGSTGLNAGVALLLQAAGWKLATGVYTPTIVESEQKTLTIDLYEDGVLKRLTGAMGKVDFSGEVGGIIYLDCEFKGIWVAPTDQALGNASASAIAPTRYASSTCTLGAYTPKLGKFTLTLNPTVILRPDASKASGYIHGLITDIEPQIDIEIEADNVATHDAYGLWLANTDADLTMLWTDGTVKETVAGGLEYRTIETANRDGVMIQRIKAQFVHATSGMLPTITVAAV